MTDLLVASVAMLALMAAGVLLTFLTAAVLVFVEVAFDRIMKIWEDL